MSSSQQDLGKEEKFEKSEYITETALPSVVTKTEFKMKNHNYQIPEESKENDAQVPESDNNEELKIQKAFLNLRGTSQFNFVKTRKPVQHRITKMPEKN